jgi:tetratricopeptide (TPR) repeat protein
MLRSVKALVRRRWVLARGAFLAVTCVAPALASPHAECPPAPALDLRAVILSSQSGDMRIDQEIARLQGKIREGRDANPLIVQLGWAFVAKARLTSDPGFYKIAEQCAQLGGEDSDCLLLRGHILHALHRFSDAELVARKIVAFDSFSRWQTYALLGDALMEQGKLSEAIDAYQRMIDIRPCLQTYARVAHVRWLKGDLAGAEELMRAAVSAGNSRDPEPAAWAYSRLAFYQLQGGKSAAASRSLARAFEFVKDYPSALFLQAKIEIDQVPAKAVQSLRIAVAQSPLPEYEWALADASRLAGNAELAATTESAILNRGAAEDQRSFALFLANRNLKPELALKLAENEISNRRDVFTYDALAWTELAAGKKQEASKDMRHALAEGTVDARLFYHAGKIALSGGDKAEAAQWFLRASAIQQMLLPSERADLTREMASVQTSQNAKAALSSTNPQLANQGLTRK